MLQFKSQLQVRWLWVHPRIRTAARDPRGARMRRVGGPQMSVGCRRGCCGVNAVKQARTWLRAEAQNERGLLAGVIGCFLSSFLKVSGHKIEITTRLLDMHANQHKKIKRSCCTISEAKADSEMNLEQFLQQDSAKNICSITKSIKLSR